MNICYFGTFDPTYTRNRINITGLQQQGITIVECRTEEKSRKKYWQLIKKHRVVRKQYEVMVVGFAGHAIMPLAWLLCKLYRKKLILDLFVSEYDSVILDRKAFSTLGSAACQDISSVFGRHPLAKAMGFCAFAF